MDHQSPQAARTSPTGWTLVELLTVIAIVGLLLALILPAVQQAREVARRTQCTSKLRQLGIAMHSYVSTHRMFPPGNSNGFSAIVFLLPYLEQSNLYQSISFDAHDVPKNGHLASTRLPLLHCPSDNATSMDSEWGTATSYAANGGTGVHVGGSFAGVIVPLADPDFFGGGAIAPGSITDGLAQTAAFSEILPSDHTAGPMRAVWQVSPYIKKARVDLFVIRCNETGRSGASSSNVWEKGRLWSKGDHPNTFYNHVSPPNSSACTNESNVLHGTYPTSSLHSGGVNCCLADGSVRFVSTSIDSETWRAIGTRAGRDVVDAF